MTSREHGDLSSVIWQRSSLGAALRSLLV